jgi:hypothetical protein
VRPAAEKKSPLPSNGIASQHTHIEHWKSLDDMEFGELPRSAHKERRNEIHETVEISQSWFNDPSTGASPSTMSKEKLVP